jgi:hypothetical protein
VLTVHSSSHWVLDMTAVSKGIIYLYTGTLLWPLCSMARTSPSSSSAWSDTMNTCTTQSNKSTTQHNLCTYSVCATWHSMAEHAMATHSLGRYRMLQYVVRAPETVKVTKSKHPCV